MKVSRQIWYDALFVLHFNDWVIMIVYVHCLLIVIYSCKETRLFSLKIISPKLSNLVVVPKIKQFVIPTTRKQRLT